MALNAGMEWINYMVFFQYIAMGLVFVWWFYTRRVKRGFKVIFCASVSGGDKGAYTIDESRREEFIKRLVTVPVVEGRFRKEEVDVEVMRIVQGVSDEIPIFLAEKEVKAGQDFVEWNSKAYFIPWDAIAYRRFGWEYMIVDITLMRSYTFGGEYRHDYDARTVQVSGRILEPMAKDLTLKKFLPTMVLACAFVGVLVAMVTYFVTNFVVQQSYIGYVPSETVQGVAFRLMELFV